MIYEKIIKLFLFYGVDINVKEWIWDGSNVLELVVRFDFESVVEMLFVYGVNVNV